MNTKTLRCITIALPLAAAGCAVVPPSGPMAVAMPKPGQDFGQFRAHDADCRDYASSQIGYGASAQAATQSAVGTAAVGTAVGAVAGAALGSIGGHAGSGAVIGALGGLMVGGAAGAGGAQASAGGLQRRYDVAYQQCMVANGYTVQQPDYQGPARYGYPGYVYAPYPYAYAPYPYGYAYPYPYPFPYGVSVGIGGGGRWRR